ncbi:hypothetical protein, partial [Mesorhizobium sp. M5C.F.Ca.IN.020.32.2.1]|uniref:hypothetical protein n=1 Tax=Mesorhizobium sp. M5C.F.Ca.IN.020.32.2.1 TaxID=2496771 RepID=UPI0019D4B213
IFADEKTAFLIPPSLARKRANRRFLSCYSGSRATRPRNISYQYLILTFTGSKIFALSHRLVPPEWLEQTCGSLDTLELLAVAEGAWVALAEG